MKKVIYVTSLSLLVSLGSYIWAENLYVDNAAAGNNSGTSWDNAWTSFAAIQWGSGTGSVGAGDILYISGGTQGGSKIYNEGLYIGASGSSLSSPVTIKVGQDPSHSGTVILDGTGTQSAGITISNRSHVFVSGQREDEPGCNLVIRNHQDNPPVG